MRKNHTFLLCTFLTLLVFFFVLFCDATYIFVTFLQTQFYGVLFNADSIARLVFSISMYWLLLFALLPLATSFIFILVSHINKISIIGAFIFILLSFFSLIGIAVLLWGALLVNIIYYYVSLIIHNFDYIGAYVPSLIRIGVGLTIGLSVTLIPCIAAVTLITAFVFGGSRMPDKYYK